MLKISKNSSVEVRFEEISDGEFCEAIKNANNVVNAIGHSSTVNLINTLCSTDFKMNRISIIASQGDIILAVILTIRLEEGKILQDSEIRQLLNEGKIKFIRVSVL
jgi:hypothetical protein